ncbi:TOG array regulator of axonemal microtubules protein 1-like [Astyanax mexicanus]|uniref:TOG array regulator of axonemal microtubules protein 1-like n=1 Tax=Astyanax mexicanus TaxID=7994 RepID=UPI0020CB3414|nr:TOG array regulator of axonemal microtubules protein 1-like [Astyanax mexicanus]
MDFAREEKFIFPKIAPWVHDLPLMRRKTRGEPWYLHVPLPPPAKPAARNTGTRFPPIKGLEQEWSGVLGDSSFGEFTSRPLHYHPTPPPTPPPVTATLPPVVVNKPPAYNSPGSRIPILDRRRKLRPVQAVVQPVNNMAAHSIIMDKPAQVERAVRKKPSKIRSAPQAVGKGQGLEQPLVPPSLTSEDALNRPEEALSQALGLLQDEEWERKIEGLRLVRALAEHHSEVVLPELHYVCKAVIAEVKNLRSIVSRDAITTMAHLFTHLQHNMDSEVEGAAHTLLHKAGETSLFIRQGVELALSTMVHHCSPGRVLRGLLDGGFRHRNRVSRAATALSLVRLLQVVGVSRVLTGRKNLASEFVPAVSTLAFDADQDVRAHARAALRYLGNHKDAERAVEKYVQLRDQSQVKKLLHN